jgi:hypothetical protein
MKLFLRYARLRGVGSAGSGSAGSRLRGVPAPRGQTEFQVNLKLGLTPWPTDPMAYSARTGDSRAEARRG